MNFFGIFKKKKPFDSESARREFLLARGRIADATIIDIVMSETGEELVFYYYTVAGADYESSEILTDEQRANPQQYAPGAKVGVRYDPKQHGNSVLI